MTRSMSGLLVMAAISTLSILLSAGCGKPPPLTAELAKSLIIERAIDREPIYAEVPQRVWWDHDSPKDDYDELALSTLRNLEEAGLVTLTREVEGNRESWIAVVTEKGFPILGKVPSRRGRALRGQICVKKIDEVRNFLRHPVEPTVGSADLVWHYANPTPLYDLFETKINKPLDKPFKSVVAIHNDKGLYKLDLTIKKVELDSGAVGEPTGETSD